MAEANDEYDDEPHYEEEHRGLLILVLGILSIALGPCHVLGVIPWLMGSGDLAKMDEGVMDPEGRTNTKTGKILGIIAFCLFCFNMLILICYFGTLIATGVMKI